jgi:simple sugar transport system substrate-binding protein
MKAAPSFHAAAVLACALAGCNGGGDGPPSSNRTYHYISHADPENPFWNTVRNGMDDAAARYGVEAFFFGATDTSTTPQEQQIARINEAVTAGVDGIAVTMSDTEMLAPAIQAAQAADIPVIAFNVGATDADADEFDVHVRYVGQDEVFAAGEAALHARDLLADDSVTMDTALCIKGMNDAAWAVLRCQGVTDALEAVGGITVTTLGGDFYANPPDTNEAEIATWFDSNPGVDFVFSTAPAVLTLLLSLQQDGTIDSSVMIASVDLNEETLDAIRDGNCEFAVDQQPYLQGYLPITLFELDNDFLLQLGDDVQTGPFFVNAENVDQIAELVREEIR